MIGKLCPFVVAWDKVNGDSCVGDSYEGLVCLFDNRGWDFAPEEHVPSMDDKVYFLFLSYIQNVVIIGKEILASPASLNSRMNRKIEAEVGIGEEKNFDEFVGHCL